MPCWVKCFNSTQFGLIVHSNLFITLTDKTYRGHRETYRGEKTLLRGTQQSLKINAISAKLCRLYQLLVFSLWRSGLLNSLVESSMLKYFPRFIFANWPLAFLLGSNVNLRSGLVFMVSFLNTSLTYSPTLSASKLNNSHFCTLSSDVNPTQPSNHLMTCFWWTSKPKRFPNWTSKMFEVSPSLYSTFQEHTPIDSGGSLESKLTIMQSGTSLATF